MAGGRAGGSGGGESGGAGAAKAEMHLAAEETSPQHIDCIHALLDAGADASLRDKGGRTALDLARRAKNTQAIEALSAHVN